MIRLAMAALIALIGISPAHGGSCGPRDKVLGLLGEGFEERPTAIGLTASGVLELLRSKDGDTWTIIVTDPEGNACVVASGEAWIELDTDTGRPI